MLLEKNERAHRASQLARHLTNRHPVDYLARMISTGGGRSFVEGKLTFSEIFQKIVENPMSIEWLENEGYYFPNKKSFYEFKLTFYAKVNKYNQTVKELNDLVSPSECKDAVETAVELTRKSVQKSSELVEAMSKCVESYKEEYDTMSFLNKLVKDEYSFGIDGHPQLTQDHKFSITIFDTEHVPIATYTSDDKIEDCFRDTKKGYKGGLK